MNKKTNRQRNSVRGFSLIEILTVVAIILIIARILLPFLVNAEKAARAVKCMNNIKQISMAMRLYIQDWGVLPGRAETGEAFGRSMWIGMDATNSVSPGHPASPKDGALAKYINNLDGHNDQLYVCPETALKDSSDYLKSIKLSYVINGWMGNFVKFDRIADPSGTYLIMESRGDSSCGVWTPNDGSHFWSVCDKGGDRHQGGGFVAFADGHINRITAAHIDYETANCIGLNLNGIPPAVD